jgi:predicted ATPase/DNA-binding SARP family transcriptional activator
MRFGILGPTQVELAEGREVVVRGPRLRALLVLLLLDAGRVVPAERLIDGLYGEDPPAGAANALQSQVSRLRQALSGQGGPTLVEFHPAGYRLAVETDDVDAHRFARLSAEGHRALATGDLIRAAALLQEALELWRGEPLADVLDTPFARGESARLEEQRLAAVEDRIDAQLGLGENETLIVELRALVGAHPLRERLRGQLMRALHGGGRRADALAVFEDARRALAEELGVDPSADLAAVHVAVLRGEEPLAHASPARSRLPSQLTSFVGREDELQRVGKLLDQTRLVTVTGPGGAGKTRLAIEAAGRLGGDLCFVELAALSDGADVPQAVLHALGLRDAGLRAPADRGRDATDRLVAALADRALLLVLDNCEHLITDVSRLAARLLGACATLRILATSREPLGLTGEALCPVSGLALPPEGTSAMAAEEYGAVRLFADRAADVAADFAVTPANTEAIQQICRTLDGLPLAIELAAARLHTLPVAEVATRLDDRFRLLSRGSRTAEKRHQTLHAVVGWSWDLLDDGERALARRLTVFAGGATLAAVDGVCGLPAPEVVDVLSGLVDKSLVEISDGRYRMLDTVRAFCAERLADAAETEQLRLAHAAYFLDLAQTADPHLRRAEQLEWLSRLDVERDNVHAALRRALAQANVDMALRLCAALSFYWWVRGLRGEAAALTGELLACMGAGPPPGLDEEYALCVLTASLGGFATVEAYRTVGSAESILRVLGQPPRQPFLLFLAAMASGPPADTPDHSVAALLERWRPLIGPDPWSHALVALGLGSTWLFHGQVEQAQRQLVVALDGFRAVGDRWGAIVVLAATAEIAYWRDDHAASIAPMEEALQLASELNSTLDMSDLLRIRGDGYVRANELGRAEDDYVRAMELARQAGAPEMVAAARAGLGELARVRGDLGAALRFGEAALAECPVGWFGADATRFGILVGLGRITEATGDAEAASAWYRLALTETTGVRTLPELAQAIEGLVGIELASGDAEQAAILLGATTALRDAAGAVNVASIAATVRSQLGDADYESAFGRGAEMTREQARALIAGN